MSEMEFRAGDRVRVTVEFIVVGPTWSPLQGLSLGAENLSNATIELIRDPRLAVVKDQLPINPDETARTIAQRILDALDAHANEAGR